MTPLAANRRWIAAPLLGALAAWGFEPVHLWPAALIGLAGLLALLARTRSARGAFGIGWLFGIGHFTLGLWWIATAFTFQAAMPAWLGGIAVVLLSLYLAVWPGLAAMGGWWLARGHRAALVAALAGCWIAGEWLRGWVFTGFPWNPLAAVALGGFSRPGLAAVLRWIGTYALSGAVVALAGSWWLALERRRADARGAALAIVPALALLFPGLPATPDPAGGRAYTLVQPGIPEDVLNDPADFEHQFAISAALSLPRQPGQARVVLWPDSGVQEPLEDGYPAGYYAIDPALMRERIARAIGPGAILLSGTTGLEFAGHKLIGARNSVTALDGAGRIRGRYYKAHLVPYGEYLPMRWLLGPLGLARLVPGDVDFWPGPGPRSLDLGALGKVGVQDCYEIVFPGAVIDRAHRPDFLFNPSNDGWYGPSGPPQFLAHARLRAIEEGVPVLRSTTTGISAVIDADGRVRAFIPRGVADRRDGLIPPAHPPTAFARAGNVLSLAISVLFLGVALVVRRRARR